MLTLVKIEDTTDLTGDLINWRHLDTWGEGIDELEINFSKTVYDVYSSFGVGKEIDVYRGFNTNNEEHVFEGQITSVRPKGGVLQCTCKGMLVQSVKASRTVSFDKDIDTEAGVGSELMKNYITHSGLSYSSSSITATGSGTADKIVKFIQNDEDDYTKMMELAEIYNYVLRREPGGNVVFKPKGYETYSWDLETGKNIIGKLIWEEDIEELCNKVIINGATVYDKIGQTFAGPDTEFELSNTPEDTEVRQTSGTGTLFKRGQKDVGTLGTDFDYYVDVENKKIIFGSTKSNIWTRYGAQVPMPVVIKNQSSIDTYGIPDETTGEKLPSVKKFTYNDIKDIADAEKRGRAYLSKYSTPFNATEITITDEQLQLGIVKPGYIVHVIDNEHDKTEDVFVREVIKTFPHKGDKLVVGDKIWRTEDWQSDVQKQIDRLFNALNKNQDIIVIIVDLDRTFTYERRYMYKTKQDITGTTAIYGNVRQGIYGTHLYGTSLPGSASTVWMRQGANTYKEFFYDTVFDGTGTATWDTTNKELSFTSGQTRTTDKFSIGQAHTYFTVTLASVTGSLLVEITGDGGSNWQTATLGTRTAITVSTTGGVQLRFTENNSSTAKIENTYDDYGNYLLSGIKCILED